MQGTPPRRNTAPRIALYGATPEATQLARGILTADPRASVVDVDPRQADPSSCNDDGCTLQDEAGCRWALAQGFDYLARSSIGAEYKSDYQCTAWDSSLLDKNDGECTQGHQANQHTTATFSLALLDPTTCRPVGPLSVRIAVRAEGEETQSKPEALADVARNANSVRRPFPDQFQVGANGTVDAPDGYYARYRDLRYRGYMAVSGSDVHAMHCCEQAAGGDVLVSRGRRTFLELAPHATGTALALDGERYLAPGAGVALRYYPLDRGLHLAVAIDVVGNPLVHAQGVMLTPQIGWGFRPSSAMSLSANAGGGFVAATQNVASMNDATARGIVGLATANLRLITFFATWWYLGSELGVIYSQKVDSWEGDGAAGAKPMSFRAPFIRLWLGFDL